MRPLAGTRRGAQMKEDKALEAELLADDKELAEHLMLIDLSRNDSGRVSKTGSVTVPRKMFVERYSHVMHIASIVESEIRDDARHSMCSSRRCPWGLSAGQGARNGNH